MLLAFYSTFSGSHFIPNLTMIDVRLSLSHTFLSRDGSYHSYY